MAAPTAYQQYKTANVHTTDQGKLILICYDVALRSCATARDFIDKKKMGDKARKIYKAQDAITELMVALDREKGGEFAKRLYSLYEYFNWRLSEANVHADARMVVEVEGHLKALRDAWVVAIENVRKDQGLPVIQEQAPLGLVG